MRAAEDRPASSRDGRARCRHSRHLTRSRQRQSDDDRAARLYRPRRRHSRAGRCHPAAPPLTPIAGRHRLGLSPWHPAAILATWFGVGLLPVMPGTWGSLAALPCAWLISDLWGTLGLAIAIAIILAVGRWAAGTVAKASPVADPPAIVIDEVAGQWLALLPAPLAPLPYA